MNSKIFIALSFFVGYFVNDMFNMDGIRPISVAHARVAGMSYLDLKNDQDFKKAVMSIAEEQCRSDVNFNTRNTWFYCGGSTSAYAPR
jgi:hypothetical protein